jgi:hypothetical protein
MRKLRTRCAECGEVGLSASDIVVSGMTDRGRVRCSFRCPECGQTNVQYCDVEAARLLLLGGARGEPAAESLVPPLGPGDLDELLALMERPDFVALMGKAG